MLNAECSDYCGREESLGFGLGAGAGSRRWAAQLCEVVGTGPVRGASGTVVMALSGFSRWSLLGSQAQLDQRPRVGHRLALPAVIRLVAAHGLFAGLVPRARGFPAQVMLADQGFLNGLGSFGVDFLLAPRLRRLLARGMFSCDAVCVDRTCCCPSTKWWILPWSCDVSCEKSSLSLASCRSVSGRCFGRRLPQPHIRTLPAHLRQSIVLLRI